LTIAFVLRCPGRRKNLLWFEQVEHSISAKREWRIRRILESNWSASNRIL